MLRHQDLAARNLELPARFSKTRTPARRCQRTERPENNENGWNGEDENQREPALCANRWSAENDHREDSKPREPIQREE